MKLERSKYMDEGELDRFVRAVRTRASPSRSRLHAHSARDYALFSLSANTGMREIELVGVRIGDLRGVVGSTRDERPARVRVRRAKKKRLVEEEVALPDSTRLALMEYLRGLAAEEKEAHCRVFPLSTCQVRKLFRYYAARAGLSADLSMHSLRHTRGTLLYAKYRDLVLVQRALGHSSLKHTEVYLHTVDGDEKLAQLDLTKGEGNARDGEGGEAGPREGTEEDEGGAPRG